MKPYYVGFPRSGSHWVRIFLEQYTNGNSPISNFLAAKNETVQGLYKRIKNGEFKGTHDMDLNFKHDCVLYMYRHPINCIYSHMVYENINLNNSKDVLKFLDIWCRHVEKWCFNENFTKKKLVVSYESLVCDNIGGFSKILEFLNLKVDKAKIVLCNKKSSKKNIRNIVHDKKVINVDNRYYDKRIEFASRFGGVINNSVSKYTTLWSEKELLKENLNVK